MRSLLFSIFSKAHGKSHLDGALLGDFPALSSSLGKACVPDSLQMSSCFRSPSFPPHLQQRASDLPTPVPVMGEKDPAFQGRRILVSHHDWSRDPHLLVCSPPCLVCVIPISITGGKTTYHTMGIE